MTNDTITVKRIKETVAGASPNPNTWTLASPAANEVLRVKVVCVMRDASTASNFAFLLYEAVVCNYNNSGIDSVGQNAVNGPSWLYTPTVTFNGTDLELSVISNLASIEVDIRAEIEKLA